MTNKNNHVQCCKIENTAEVGTSCPAPLSDFIFSH